MSGSSGNANRGLTRIPGIKKSPSARSPYPFAVTPLLFPCLLPLPAAHCLAPTGSLFVGQRFRAKVFVSEPATRLIDERGGHELTRVNRVQGESVRTSARSVNVSLPAPFPSWRSSQTALEPSVTIVILDMCMEEPPY